MHLAPSSSALVGALCLVARPIVRVPHAVLQVQQSTQLYVEALQASPADGQAGDLAFAAGDVIAIVREGEPGDWWEGSLNGVTGYFPSSFCSAPWTNVATAGGSIKERIRARMVAAMKMGAVGKQEVAALRQMIAACTRKRKETGLEYLDDPGAIEALSKLAASLPASDGFLLGLIDEYLPAMADAGGAPPATMRAAVLYAYEAGQPDELSLQPGDVVDVLDWSEPEWWTGTLHGQTGVFPASYVEVTA